jgi:membrane associated rhomboid family serine protease
MSESTRDKCNELKKEVKSIILIEMSLIGLLWFIFIIDTFLFHNKLKQNGIHPREISGLIGILFSPFLHSGFNHIFNNMMGIIMLGTLVLLRDIHKFFIIFGISLIVSGIGVWLIGGAHTNHIGFSGIIFGFFGYLIITGFVQKKAGSIILSILTILLYGGLIWGVLPSRAGISWEGHLFGFAGGILSAVLLYSL